MDEKMERETRIELATNSLEGCDSTIELLPLLISIITSPGFDSPTVIRNLRSRAFTDIRTPIESRDYGEKKIMICKMVQMSLLPSRSGPI
jgi:hypothetical protein